MSKSVKKRLIYLNGPHLVNVVDPYRRVNRHVISIIDRASYIKLYYEIKSRLYYAIKNSIKMNVNEEKIG